MIKQDYQEIVVENVSIHIYRKNIKNVYIKIASKGMVNLSVPLQLSEESVNQIIKGKLNWIKKKLQKYDGVLNKNPANYKSGEIHYFLGEAYKLNLITWELKPKIELHEGFMDFYIKPGTTMDKLEKIMREWYRCEMKKLLPSYMDKWESIMKNYEVQCNIKIMKTRWGTCNIRERRIWLNLELVKFKPKYMEYVLVHEMIHLIERHHNKIFYGYMDYYLPHWRRLRDELNDCYINVCY